MARDEPVFMGIIASLFFICSSQISRNVVVTIVIASFIIPVSQVAPFISSASQATCTELRPYITKGNLTCFACPPGFYLSGDCTSNNTIAVCEVCPQGYYSGVSGVHTRCERCSPYCESDNLIEVSNCSSTTNLTCDCPPGKVLKDPHDKHRAICLDETTKKGNASTHNQTKADPDSDDFSIVKEDINDTKKDVKTLKKNVRAIKKDVGRLKEDVGAVKDTLNTLLKEINYIEDDFNIVQEDINATKKDVKTLKENVRAMKEDVGRLKEDVGAVKEDVGRLKEDVGAVKEGASSMKDTLNTLSEDISNIEDLIIVCASILILILIIVVIVVVVLVWFVIRKTKWHKNRKRKKGSNKEGYSELPENERNQGDMSSKANSQLSDPDKDTHDEVADLATEGLPKGESNRNSYCGTSGAPLPGNDNTTKHSIQVADPATEGLPKGESERNSNCETSGAPLPGNDNTPEPSIQPPSTETNVTPKTNNTYDASKQLEASNIAIGSTVTGETVGNKNC